MIVSTPLSVSTCCEKSFIPLYYFICLCELRVPYQRKKNWTVVLQRSTCFSAKFPRVSLNGMNATLSEHVGLVILRLRRTLDPISVLRPFEAKPYQAMIMTSVCLDVLREVGLCDFVFASFREDDCCLCEVTIASVRLHTRRHHTTQMM